MIIRCKHLIDCSGRIEENVYLTISGGYIAAMDCGDAPAFPPEECIDLGDDSILIPGLVNAHTHLELTLAQNCFRPQPLFTNWIRTIISVTSQWEIDYFSQSLRDGIQQSVACGTTAAGDIIRQADGAAYSEFPLQGRAYYEVINFDSHTADKTSAALKRNLAEHPTNGCMLAGISPHSPYTVSEELLRQCVSLGHSISAPLCIHLGETVPELEFLREGTGELRRFREELGMPPGWTPPKKTPVEYFRDLGGLDRPAVLVHCNYADENDLKIIAASGSSVVFCPRSHQYFRHRRHPVEAMLQWGINVAIGTDSLASSPSLSVLDEMKALRRSYSGVSSIDILKMATLNGLRALSLPHEEELLRPGRPADITVIRVGAGKEEQDKSPLEAIFADSSGAFFSLIGGKIALRSVEREARKN